MASQRKPATRQKWQPPDPYPKGASVRITGGKHAGKTGMIVRAYLGRPAPLNVVYVELSGGLRGWSIAVPVNDLEVTG